MNTEVSIDGRPKANGSQQAGVLFDSYRRLQSPRRPWPKLAFLCRASLGGALGGYLVDVGFTVDAVIHHQWSYIPIPVVLFIFLPVYMLFGSLLGLVTGGMTLILENLIEEKLTMAPRAVATAIFSVVALACIGSFWVPLDWALIKQVFLPGLGLGLPVGLFASTKLRLRHLLIYGAHLSSKEDHHPDTNQIMIGLGSIGAVALRLVGIVGVLISIESLIVFWKDLEVHERMVVTYAIYYFACTTAVSLCVRSKWLIGAAAFLLNGLLLILAMFWEPSNGVASPLPLAFTVLAILWLLFMVGRPVERRLNTTYQTLGELI